MENPALYNTVTGGDFYAVQVIEQKIAGVEHFLIIHFSTLHLIKKQNKYFVLSSPRIEVFRQYGK